VSSEVILKLYDVCFMKNIFILVTRVTTEHENIS